MGSSSSNYTDLPHYLLGDHAATWMPTTYYSLPTTHYLLLTTDYSPPTTHYLLRTTYYALPTTTHGLLGDHTATWMPPPPQQQPQP